jgi:hypothetical protein
MMERFKKKVLDLNGNYILCYHFYKNKLTYIQRNAKSFK